jgi:cell division protein FtsB
MVLLALIVIVLMMNVRAWRDRRAQQGSIAALKNEIAALEAQEQSAKDFLEELQSPYFIEQEARARLGYQRPGESVVIFPSAQDATAAEDTDEPAATNPEQWIAYFFESR